MTNKDGIDLNEYKSTLSNTLVTELFSIIAKDRKEHGDTFADELALSIICSMIATIVHKSLVETLKPDIKRKSTEYHVMKAAIENMVGSAFTGASISFNSQSPIDFVCQVTRVGDSPSKVLN